MSNGEESGKSVFEKLHEASQLASGVDLTELDVHLLLETAGDAIFGAEADCEKWQEIFEECKRIKHRASSS